MATSRGAISIHAKREAALRELNSHIFIENKSDSSSGNAQLFVDSRSSASFSARSLIPRPTASSYKPSSPKAHSFPTSNSSSGKCNHRLYIGYMHINIYTYINIL